MRKIILIVLLQVVVSVGMTQELMAIVEDSQVSSLFDLPGVVTLADGSKIAGTVDKAFLSKGRLTDIALKIQDGSTRKFKASEIESAKVRVKTPTVFSVVDNDGNPIKKVIYTQVVFEHPFKAEKGNKSEMRQLLNPVFDSRIKIFGIPSSGGKSYIVRSGSGNSAGLESYLFVKGSETFYVKERTYKRDFSSIYGDCAKVIETVPADQIDISGVASHSLLYDHYCGVVK
jgi:hypothetical protein